MNKIVLCIECGKKGFAIGRDWWKSGACIS